MGGLHVDHVRDSLRTVVEGRRWIVATNVLAGGLSFVQTLRELGADDVFVVAGSRGTGDLPDHPDHLKAILGIEGGDMMGAIRTCEASFDALPEEVVARIDAFDPDREARVLRALFSAGRPLAGRPTWGVRAKAWQDLEDKTVVDALWDAAGVTRAPRDVVEATTRTLLDAHRRLDRGRGTVWAADNTEGFHGGAAGTRWARDDGDEADRVELARWFEARFERVRVMPFLDGVPCSVHGVVFEDCEIAVRPVEMLVLRRAQASFLYAGVATFWDPTPEVREAMRAAARRVGRHLRLHYGYRGVFTIDGVATEAGFLPTELNPRFGGALSRVAGPELPMYLVHCALVEEEPLPWRPDELEELLLQRGDSTRRGGAGVTVDLRIEEQRSMEVRLEGPNGCREILDGEEADAKLTLGPAAAGGYLRISLVAERTPVGPSAAGRVAAACRFADLRWDTGIGPLEPATARV